MPNEERGQRAGEGEGQPASRADPHDGNQGADKLTVVALGASAGGMAAISAFLERLPGKTGLAFVAIQHLDPLHESHLAALLAKATTLPVVQIEDGMRLAPDRVHVLPPGTSLTIHGNELRLLLRDSRRPMPIDEFLEALALERGPRAIAVILSGSGSDGSQGARFIQEHGGICLAQDPQDASAAGMPSSAIASGCVDIVLPAAQLAEEVVRIAKDLALTSAAGAIAPDDPLASDGLLQQVIDRLRSAAGIDLGQYRRTTLGRRLRRRIALCGLRDLRSYLDHVDGDPGELQELAKDLLISVTRFFRDPEVFVYLSQSVFPDLIRRAADDNLVRIWVTGCSTGEEAYSLAITFVETARRLNSQVTCQVFATDINEAALRTARRAVYRDNIASDVSQRRMSQFFTVTEGGHRVHPAIRDLCIFSHHDIVRDPPLSRMDLVSCRNLLIYLESAQRPVLSVLHFALEPRGYLLLGRAETAATCPDLFESVDKDKHVFRAREAVSGRSRSSRDPRRPPRQPVLVDPESSEAAYEELVAANEELQSLNEELESSKEEIESVNEELLTLNEELGSRNTALHIANEFSQATLDTVRSALIVLDRDQLVINANRSFYEMFALTSVAVERRRLADIAPDYFSDPGVCALLDRVRNGDVDTSHVEFSFDLPDQGSRVLVMHAARLEPIDQILVSVDDVTLLRRLEADSRQSQKIEAIGHLAAGVAHDFNNLLTVIQGGAQSVIKQLAQDSPQRPIMEDVSAAARRAAELTRQLLAYAGRSRQLIERVALSDVVFETADLLHSAVPSHVQLRLDLERDLPLLLADRSQLHQIADNLIKNALEAIGDAQGTVTVRTGQQTVASGAKAGVDPGTRLPPGEYLFLEVRDTGVGMTPAQQRQMFDPFFTTKFTGRGLGLAAVQGIVRQHRGTVEVESVAGRGTSIRALFAVGTGPEDDQLGPRKAKADAPRRSHGTILVIDDEPMILRTMQAVLKAAGYGVLTASSGAQGIERLREDPQIAAVLLDAMMPGMNGLETLAALRAIRPELPVVVCSGSGDAAVEASFAGQRVAGFLHKPFKLDDLGDRLARYLDAAGQAGEHDPPEPAP